MRKNRYYYLSKNFAKDANIFFAVLTALAFLQLAAMLGLYYLPYEKITILYDWTGLASIRWNSIDRILTSGSEQLYIRTKLIVVYCFLFPSCCVLLLIGAFSYKLADECNTLTFKMIQQMCVALTAYWLIFFFFNATYVVSPHRLKSLVLAQNLPGVIFTALFGFAFAVFIVAPVFLAITTPIAKMVKRTLGFVFKQ